MKPWIWLAPASVAVVLIGCGKPQPEASQPAKTVVASAGSYPTPQKERSGRASVQHGIDPDASLVNRTPEKITVEQLISLRKKAGDNVELASYPNKRIAPFETNTYQIDARIKSIKHEKDGDFYFVIQGDSGAQAVVEVPDPSLCKGSPMLSDIEKTRKTLYDKFHPTDTDQATDVKATIVGVGYMGTRKRKSGGTFASSARLMPGTAVTFPDSP